MELTVKELVRRFDSGEIRLPLMQRDYVWRPKKVVKLLDSLYKRWPIGCFYVWRGQESHATKKRSGQAIARPLDGFYGFLLDGQQRLTSISLAIQAEAEGEEASRAFFDLENEAFFLGQMNRTIVKRIAVGDPTLVPLSEVISFDVDREAEQRNVEVVIERLRERGKLGKNGQLEARFRVRLRTLADMLGSKALCDEFNDEHEDDAFELFQRLNKGGTSLSAGDVEAARLASAATRRIVTPMREFVQEREMRVMGINFVFLLRTLVTVHRGNCSFSKLPKNWASDADEVDQSWKDTERGLRAVVQFVRDQFGWTSRRWLPSTLALLPIAYMVAKHGVSSIRGKNIKWVRRYLLVTGLRGAFRGTTETTVNGFVNAFRNATSKQLETPGEVLFRRIPKNQQYRLSKDDVRASAKMYGPLMQIYFAYLYDREARSWRSGRTIRDLAAGIVPGDPIAVHHIFPKKFMHDLDVPVDKLNTMANYAILAQSDNSELSDQNPYDAWQSLSIEQKEWASVQLCFSANDQLLKTGAYEEFVSFRSEKLAARLNQFLGFA